MIYFRFKFMYVLLSKINTVSSANKLLQNLICRDKSLIDMEKIGALT